MVDLDRTEELITISTIEAILSDDDTYLDFINHEGMFIDIDDNNYVNAINDYMTYVVDRSSNIDESVFKRVNNINNIFKTGNYYDYLYYSLQTERFITIDIIERILSDEDVYDKFLKFNDNQSFFQHPLIVYLVAIWDYFSYMKKSNLGLEDLYLSRYAKIVQAYSLDFKRAVVLSGEHVQEKLSDDIALDILKNIDMDQSKFDIALDIYIELCKRCEYDPEFYALKQDRNSEQAMGIYNQDIEKLTGETLKVVCRGWAVCYQDLLTRCGFKANVEGRFHKFVVFDCDGTMMKADGTNFFDGRKDNFILNDLMRAKLGFPVSGFMCMEADKNISNYLDLNDEKHENDDKTMEELVNEYMKKYMVSKERNFNEALDKFLNHINTKLHNVELIKYINLLYKIYLKPYKDIQMDKNYLIYKDENKQYRASILISYEIDGEVVFWMVNDKDEFVNVSKNEIEEMLNSGIVEKYSKDKEIFGLDGKKNGYSM